MHGIILAGGEGTRLKPVTDLYVKPAALVYDRPMIQYSLDTLEQMGCDEATIVTNQRGISQLPKVIRSDLNISYIKQEEPKGMAHAIYIAMLFQHTKGVFPVLAADTYFDPAPQWTGEPTIFWSHCSLQNAKNFGIYDPETKQITEKPTQYVGNMAVIAAYIYDERFMQAYRTLEPSERGEYEITDINNWYLEHGIRLQHYSGTWGDMGTPDGVVEIAKEMKLKHIIDENRVYV